MTYPSLRTKELNIGEVVLSSNCQISLLWLLLFMYYDSN